MDLNTFREYIRLHTISLEQDLEAIETTGRWANDRIILEGAINVSRHYLSVLEDTIN